MLSYLWILAGLVVAVSATENPLVKIDSGELEGHVVDGMYVFQGIPFAEPPERLQYPVKKQPWTGVRAATVTPPRCTQNAFNRPSSEDCLFLSVIAPPKTEKSYPVIVIVHGGAFSTGGVSETNIPHVGKHLVAKGVVVVPIQYRTGPLGFCTTGDSVIPGNYGIFDVKMALEWVRDNIAAFGGDPNSMTAYGGSAGASTIDALLLNDDTSKLFHRMIIWSAVARDIFVQDVKISCKRFLAEKGLDVSTPEKMRASILAETNLDNLKSGWAEIHEDAIDKFAIDWAPVNDGIFFKGDIPKLRQNAPKKPMIIGMADLEGGGFTRYFANTTEAWRADLNRLLENIVPKTTTNRENVIRDLQIEYDNYAQKQKTTDDSMETKSRVAFEKAFGEQLSASVVFDEIDYYLKKHGDDNTVPIYLYNFKWHDKKYNGAFHSMDQWYSINSVGLDFEKDLGNAAVRDLYTNIIVNFAMTGDPNGSGSETALKVEWQSIKKDHPNRNFVIDYPDSSMQEDYYNGRPEKIRNWAIEMGTKPEL